MPVFAFTYCVYYIVDIFPLSVRLIFWYYYFHGLFPSFFPPVQVYERIKAPLMTLVSSGSSEQSYAVLCHLHLLVMRAPILFSSDYKHFYCRYSDPSYIKKLKLEMLTAVANESNTYEIGMDALGFLVVDIGFFMILVSY